MHGTGISALQCVSPVKRFTCITVIIAEQNAVVNGGTHKDTLHDQKCKEINAVTLEADDTYGNIHAALYQKHEDYGHRNRTESYEYYDENSDSCEQGNQKLFIAERQAHFVVHCRRTDKVVFTAQIVT